MTSWQQAEESAHYEEMFQESLTKFRRSWIDPEGAPPAYLVDGRPPNEKVVGRFESFYDGVAFEELVRRFDAQSKEMRRIRECCEQGRLRAQHFMNGHGKPTTAIGLMFMGVVASLQNDFVEALDADAFINSRKIPATENSR